MSFYDAFDKPDRPTPTEPVHYVVPAGGDRYAEKAFEAELRAVAQAPEGQRNDTLNRAAFNLYTLVAVGRLDHQRVHDALGFAARSIGLDDQEIRATLNSAHRAGLDNPRTIPDLPTIPTITIIETDQEDPAAQIRGYLPAIDWHALWADQDEEEWILEPLLPARRLIALYSPPKVGKSLLMLELAVAIARGTPVLGTKPDRPRRVLYVDFENDPKGDLRPRLQAMGYGPADLDDLAYLSFPTLSALDSEPGGQQLMLAVDAYAAEVVVIDTVSRAIRGEENENDTWLAFYRHTGKLMKAAGVAMVRLDHTGKDETKGQRGGSAKGGDVDAVWRMSEVVKDTTYRLDCELNRMPVAERTLVIHRKLIPHLRHEVDAHGRAAAWDAKVQALIDAMDTIGLPADAGRDTASEALRTSGVKARNDVIAEAVKRRKIAVPDWRGQVTETDLSHDLGDRSGTGDE